MLKTILKSTLLSTVLLNVAMLFLEDTFHPFVLILSFMILGFISTIMLMFTVYPFLLLNMGKSNSAIFKAYFPIYAMLTLFVYLCLLSYIQFYTFQCVIVGIAYFTGLQSWVWLFSHEKNNI